MFLKPKASIDTEDEDYDDTPLFTREACKQFKRHFQDIPKSTISESIPKSPPKELKHRSSFLESYLFATVLEDILIQLRILDESNNELRLYKTQSDMPALCRNKYGVVLSQMTDELNSDPPHFTAEYHQLDKLVADRKFCSDVLKSTYLDLVLKSSYTTLVDTRLASDEQENYYNFLLEEEARNRMARRDVTRQLRQQRIRMKATVYDNETIVARLTSRIEDATLVKETRERYIDKWQQARAEQHTYCIQTKENVPSENTTIYRKKLEDEQRIHNEVELLNNIRLNEVLEEADVWMAKYEKDVEAIELKIQLQMVDLDAQVAIREEMKNRLVEHAEALKKWVSFKEERERLRLYNERMTAAAVAVQAWWRGLLVRLELGPFKPKRGPPKKEKKKKK